MSSNSSFLRLFTRICEIGGPGYDFEIRCQFLLSFSWCIALFELIEAQMLLNLAIFMCMEPLGSTVSLDGFVLIMCKQSK